MFEARKLPIVKESSCRLEHELCPAYLAHAYIQYGEPPKPIRDAVPSTES